MADVYSYPDSGALKNKLGIRDKDRLYDAEIKLVAIRLYQLQESPIHGKFDFKHLCLIHQHIFQDIYSWAGEVRKVNIAKGNMFCLTQHIQSYVQTIFPAYYTDCMRARDDFEGFIHVFTSHYADLNALHPFREGNGRAQREFSCELCLACGYRFDLTLMDHEEMLSASIASFDKGNNTKLESIFRKCIKPLSSNL